MNSLVNSFWIQTIFQIGPKICPNRFWKFSYNSVLWLYKKLAKNVFKTSRGALGKASRYTKCTPVQYLKAPALENSFRDFYDSLLGSLFGNSFIKCIRNLCDISFFIIFSIIISEFFQQILSIYLRISSAHTASFFRILLREPPKQFLWEFLFSIF